MRVAKWIAKQGLPTEIVLTFKEGWRPDFVPTEITVTNLRVPVLKYGKKRYGHLPMSVLPLIPYLRSVDITAFIALGYLGVIPAILVHRFTKSVPVIAWEQLHLRTALKYTARNDKFYVWVIEKLLKATYPRADRIVASSKDLAKDLLEFTGVSVERVRIIYNPYDPEIERKANEPLSHPWFSNGQLPVILGVGRLHVQKDFPTLIQAFALVRQNRPCRLVILGEGEERPKLERLVRELGLENDVSLAGFEPNPFKFMKNASVFVLSSKYEGFGNVIIEALACGCPVVSTDCPSGPSEILEDGKWGKLVPVGDVEAMAKAILETLDNPPDRKALQQRAMDFHI
ncbi:MAG: glycosyltransferase, partial [Candidatus Bathyarchaeia archaeon]